MPYADRSVGCGVELAAACARLTLSVSAFSNSHVVTQSKPWRIDELKECEEAFPRLNGGDLYKASRLYKAKKQEGDVTDSTQKFLWTCQKKREEKLSSAWTKWNKVVNGRNKLDDDVLLDSEECYK